MYTYRKGELLLAFHDEVFPSVADFLQRFFQPSRWGFLYTGGNICECEDSAMGIWDVVEPRIRTNIFAGPFTVQIVSP